MVASCNGQSESLSGTRASLASSGVVEVVLLFNRAEDYVRLKGGNGF
jgi:hypothetical protein